MSFGPSAVDLSQPRGVTVVDRRIIAPVYVQADDGDATVEGCVGHLKIIEPAKARCYIVPLPVTAIMQLLDELTQLRDTYVSQLPHAENDK